MKKTFTIEEVTKIIMSAEETPESKNKVSSMLYQLISRGFVDDTSPLFRAWEQYVETPENLRAPLDKVFAVIIAKEHATHLMGVLNGTEIIGPHHEKMLPMCEEILNKKEQASNQPANA